MDKWVQQLLGFKRKGPVDLVTLSGAVIFSHGMQPAQGNFEVTGLELDFFFLSSNLSSVLLHCLPMRSTDQLASTDSRMEFGRTNRNYLV